MDFIIFSLSRFDAAHFERSQRPKFQLRQNQRTSRDFLFNIFYLNISRARLAHKIFCYLEEILTTFCFFPKWNSFWRYGVGSPKFERHPPGAPWPTFHKSNDEKLFLISILKALEILETFRSGLVGLSLITRKTGASGQF
jgi:hypothetical protein